MKLAIAFLACGLSSASGAVALVAHTGSLTAAGADGAVTVAMNTTGATLLTVAVAVYNQSAAGIVLTDSNGNSWRPLTTQLGISTQAQTNIWYAYDHSGSPLVVGALHTVAITCSACYPGMDFSAWSGTLTGSDPIDVQNGGGVYGSSFTVASIAPSQAGELIITSFVDLPGSSYTVNSPFTVIDATDYNGGITMGNASAYLVQGAAAPVGATWTLGSGGRDAIAASIAAFLPASGSPPTSMSVIW